MQKNHAILGQTLKAGFFTSLALAIGAGVAGGTAIARAIKPKEKAPSVLQPKAAAVPVANQTAEQIQTKAKETATQTALKKRRSRTKTVLTGPRGLLTEPKTETKGLAGTLG